MSEDFFIKRSNGVNYLRFEPKNINGTAYVLHNNCAINYGQGKYTENTANWNDCASWSENDIKISTVGTNGKSSYYGTFDQNGNVWEWTDGNYFGAGANGGGRKVLRGGGYGTKATQYLRRISRSGPLSAISDTDSLGDDKDKLIRAGFRIATITNSLNINNLQQVTGDNLIDITNFGKVSYNYYIGKYLITNEEYVDFLNNVAATDTNGLFYNGSDDFYGITRSGTSGSYSYSVKTNMANKPVVRISWFMAARYCNWLHNNKPTGLQDSSTTEDGAYDLTTSPYNTTNFSSLSDLDVKLLVKKPEAKYWIPSEDEWFKAAYYDPTRFETLNTSITISDLNNTGSGISNAVASRDPNWKIVAVPASWTAPESIPYSGYVYDKVPSSWVGQSSYVPETLEYSEKWRDGLWIGPQTSPSSLLVNDVSAGYNVIYETTFNASDAGNAYVFSYTMSDNQSRLFVNGTIDSSTNPEKPTIVNGTPLYNKEYAQSNGEISSYIWSGIVPVVEGTNKLYVVATDFGGYQGIHSTNDPVLYWNFATRSTQEEPCCVNTLSNGDGVGSIFNCLEGSEANVTISQGNPCTITLVGHLLNNNDEVYFTTDGTLPEGLIPYLKYYVTNAQTNTFQVTYKLGCPPIATSSSGSGTHTVLYEGELQSCLLGFPKLTDCSLTQITCNSTPVTGINISWSVKDIAGYSHTFVNPAATYKLCNYEYIKPSGGINVLVGSGDVPQYDTAPAMIIRAIIKQPSSACYCDHSQQLIFSGRVSDTCSVPAILNAVNDAGYLWPTVIVDPSDFICGPDYSDYSPVEGGLPPGCCDLPDCTKDIKVYAYCCGTLTDLLYTNICQGDCPSAFYFCDSNVNSNCGEYTIAGMNVSIRDIAYAPISPNLGAVQHIGASGNFVVTDSSCLSYINNGIAYSGSNLNFTNNTQINLMFSIKLPDGKSSGWTPAGVVNIDENGTLSIQSTGNASQNILFQSVFS